MFNTILIFVSSVGVMLIFIVLVWWRFYILCRRLLKPLLPLLQGKIFVSLEDITNVRLAGTWDGKKVNVLLSPGRGVFYPTQIIIIFYQHFPFEFKAVPLFIRRYCP